MAKRQFAVIGLGKFGAKLVETLAERNAEIIGVDKKVDLVEKVKKFLDIPIHGDCTDEEFAKEHLSDVDVAVVCIGENKLAAIEITSLLRKVLGDKKEIITRAPDEATARVLKRVGATSVIMPEEAMAIQVANTIFAPSIVDYRELGADYDIIGVEAKGEIFVGKKIKDLKLREKFKLNVILIKKKVPEKKEGEEEVSKEIREIPYPNYKIEEGNILMIMGEKENIKELQKVIAKKSEEAELELEKQE